MIKKGDKGRPGTHQISHSHKTKKRLEIKRLRLEEQKKKHSKKKKV